MNNRLIVAAAGSGKTTYLVKNALLEITPILITTFTIANGEEIRKKFIELNGCVPSNVTIQTWDSFLLQHGVRPFQGVLTDEKINGMILVNQKSGHKYGNVYYGEEEFEEFYFSKERKIYSDKIAKFVCRCNEKSNGAVIRRISRVFCKIYIDEVQDLAGYDLEIIKLLMKSTSDLLMVGDPRQVTYHTHNEAKYKKYSQGNIEEFILEQCKKIDCYIDKETLNVSFRNNDLICKFSSFLYPEYDECISVQNDVTEHDGIFLVKEKDIVKYLKKYKPMQLRDKRNVVVNNEFPVMNMGESKGLTFDRVLIYPTGPMLNWIKDHRKELKPKSKSQLYVAITRARYSVGIVCDYNDKISIEGVEKY